MIEPSNRRRGLSLGHMAGIGAVAVVGGIVAVVIFLWVAHLVFSIIAIAAVVVVIGLVVRWLVGRALR
jgi:hypothetical protein